MKEILIPSTQSDTLVSQLQTLYRTFKNLTAHEQVHFNLENLQWGCPLLILPLSAHISCTGSTFTAPSNANTKSYLDAVSFPAGVDSLSSFEQQIRAYKTYLPLSVLRTDAGVGRERLEAEFLNMVVAIVGDIPGTQNALRYPVGELVTNIFEHSGEQQGFIFGQWYPKKGYLDICIVDCGRGLTRAYKEERGLDLSDEEAIAEAMKGTSAKSDTERGYGIHTSKDVVCRALKGGFVMVSGNTGFYAYESKEQLVSLPNFNWPGVIVAYRIPKPTGEINITPYLE